MSDNCSVCQDLFKTPKLLTCGHTFCRKCIDDIVESQNKREIKCPLCRMVTKLPNNGAKDLIENFFASDRKYSTTILRCAECKVISSNKRCRFCGKQLCENCMLSHIELKCGKLVMQPLAKNDEPPIQGELPIVNMQSFEGQSFQSNFCFDIDMKIVIPNLFWGDRENALNINVSILSCFNGKNCIVVPNGEKVVFIYDESGNESTKQFIDIHVFSIAGDISGYPLMIENGTSMIYDYSNETIRQRFWAQPLLPYDIACLNNGRIVLVGMAKILSTQGLAVDKHGAMRIYERDGRLCRDIIKEDNEFLFGFPRKVCINIQNNDIYVGDIKKKQVMRFREDGKFVSLYKRRETENIVIGSGGSLEIHVINSIFPLALAYCQQNHLLFALCMSHERSIHVLSPYLELLGMFSSDEDLGVPVGLSCDNKGRLYVGDNADGIIRVFKLSRFVNRL